MKNEMLALILAGGQGTRLGKSLKASQNQLCNLVGATVSLTLLSQTVPTQHSQCWSHHTVSTTCS